MIEDSYLIVYSRGFIGAANRGLNKEVEKKSIKQQVIDLRFNNRSMTKAKDTNDVFNINITKMYRSLISSTLTRDKLTVVKAIVLETFRNFATNDLSLWINLQKQSRYFSLKHQKFIIDTFRFIKTGKRDTSIRNWEVILQKKPIEDNESVTNNPLFEKEINDFYSWVGDGDKVVGQDLRLIIPKWLSNRGGQDDLLLTLNIIFGKNTVQ